MHWFRRLHGTLADPIWRRVAYVSGQPIERGMIVAQFLEEAASRHPVRDGRFDADAWEISDVIGCKPEIVEQVLDALAHPKVALVVTRDDGVQVLARWASEQRVTDRDPTAAERKRRQRSRQADARAQEQARRAAEPELFDSVTVTRDGADVTLPVTVTPAVSRGTGGDVTRDRAGRDSRDITPIGVRGGAAAVGSPGGSTLKAHLMGELLDWLAQASGRTQQGLRPLMGRWLRDFGEAPTHAAVMAACSAGPAEPVGFIESILRQGDTHAARNQRAADAEAIRLGISAAMANAHPAMAAGRPGA